MGIRDLVIIGTGGFAREVLWLFRKIENFSTKYNVLGFVDNTPGLKGKLIDGLNVIGDDKWLMGHSKEVCAVICIGNPKTRKHVYNELKQNSNICFPTIIADDVNYSESVDFGQGCIVCLSNVLTVNVKIGEFVIINLDCTVGHDAVLDDFVTLNPSVNVSGHVHIGTCTEIGTGVNIVQGRNVGENVVIGAGSVVVRDIPSNCTAFGVPATPIKEN